MNIAIITGASSGIGREFVLTIDKGFKSIDELWLISRSKDKMTELSKDLSHKTKILKMDITKEGQLDRLDDMLEEQNAVVRMLINSAGYGTMGSFEEQELDTQLGMVKLNCEALTNITYRVLPYMKKNSRIIQMASSAAFMPQPNFAIYAATKAYVLSFSRALYRELKKKGIYVTAVCPGPVDTPFFDIAQQNTDKRLAIKDYVLAKPAQIVNLALKDSYNKKDISVYGMPIKSLELFAKLLPHSMLLNIESILPQKTTKNKKLNKKEINHEF